MSIIFDAMLILEMFDPDAIDALNADLRERDSERHQEFRPISMHEAGGTKLFTTDVYAAAFNHFAPNEVRMAVINTPWRDPERVVYVAILMDYTYDDEIAISSRTIKQMREE